MKIIGCVVTIIVGLALTSILYYYLSLYREAPWTYFYYFERPLIWILVALVCTCILSRTASDWVGMFIGNWIRAGGFWAFWTKNNTFGVTWVVIAVILTWNAIAYGPGSSKADWVKIQYDAKGLIVEAVSQPEDQSTVGGIKGTVNYLAQGFLGKDVIASGDEAKKVESLLPRLAQAFLGKDVIDPKGG
ncbi:MAG: hypothetical protein Q7K65_01635, partial [Candidatus Buchananbacteria bacterium]|nr:hypothetical protein [Candidatus Buchananbacteria bacterium]